MEFQLVLVWCLACPFPKFLDLTMALRDSFLKLPSFLMVERSCSQFSACWTMESTMVLEAMPLALSNTWRMAIRSMLTKAMGLRKTSILLGNSWRPLYSGDDVKHRKDFAVTTNISPLGRLTLLADFFRRILFNVSAMIWIQGTKVDNCSSFNRSMVEQQSQAPE